MSKRIALRVLIHLVGDIHQPLHCGTGYYDVRNLARPKLISRPSEAARFRSTEDRGGNQLFYGAGKFDELHAYWDSELVKSVAGGSGSVKQLVTRLRSNIPKVKANTSGNHDRWAEEWADESIKLASGAYSGLRMGRCTLSPQGKITRINIDLPPNYKQKETPIVRDQLSKASLRLAALLNTILE
jgi:S1/P1 nuclease